MVLGGDPLVRYRKTNGWVWIFFAGCMLIAFLTIYFTYPETKGVSIFISGF